MAIWQASFYLVPTERVATAFPGWYNPEFGLDYIEHLPTEDPGETDWWIERQPPDNLRAKLDVLLPRLRAYAPDVEWWGVEDGDRFDIYATNGQIDALYVRFDMRAPNAALMRGVVTLGHELGASFVDGAGTLYECTDVGPAVALRNAQAVRFVENPIAFLSELRADRDR